MLEPSRTVLAVLGALAIALTPALAGAQPGLIPGPGEDGYDADLAAKADAYDRQLHQLLTVPLGWTLEAYVSDPADRALIDAFFASGAADFRTQSGRHPYEVIDEYGEMGDLGMFGGVQAAGDAFRYAVLRDSGAPAADVDAARAALLRAMDGLHWYHQVTGVPGVTARGLQRITPEPGEPPLPGPIPETLPLFDGAGNPQPEDKTTTWRADQSGELPFLIWFDDTSKDQLDGYVFALGVIYDVTAGDPTIPRDRLDRLTEDARAIALKLMESVPVAGTRESILVIQDADGRPTSFHDLSAEEVAPGALFDRPTNGFNGWMALGIIRTLYAITGDERIGRFYYEELLGARDYLGNVEDTLHLQYLGEMTNYSNVNMAFVAAYGVLRYETDVVTARRARTILESSLYSVGEERDADDLGQTLFDVIFAAFRSVGVFGDGGDAREDGIQTLREFPAPPYWDPEVINCDPGEIAALRCTGIDGTTEIVLSSDPGRGGGVVAVDPVPKRLRPPSNYEWRSDPHSVNGGGGARLNPGGDFHAAYWMGRYLRATEDGRDNVSPHGREPFAIPRRPDAGRPGLDGGMPPDGSTAMDGGGGCGCQSAGDGGASLVLPAVLLALALGRRARRRITCSGARRGGAPSAGSS